MAAFAWDRAVPRSSARRFHAARVAGLAAATLFGLLLDDGVGDSVKVLVDTLTGGAFT